MHKDDFHPAAALSGEARETGAARRPTAGHGSREYRRAFIMLRPAASGWSGHVRLERRVMTGSMYFIASAPEAEGALHAALVGQRSGALYAAPLGALKRDSRGQYTLAYAFDPRSIDGRPLEAYSLIALALVGAGECRVVLTGNVEGAHPMDASAVREAVCALYLGNAPAADLPAPESEAAPTGTPGSGERATGSGAVPVEAAPVEAAPLPEEKRLDALPAGARIHDADGAPEPASGQESADADIEPRPASANAASDDAPATSQASADPPAADGPREQPSHAQGTRIYTRMRAARAAREEAGNSPADSRADQPPAGTSDIAPVPADGGDAGLSLAAFPTDSGDMEASPAPTNGGGAARGDGSGGWALPLEDGYTYVRLPLPAACGAETCLLGIRAEDDRVRSVRVAFPGSYAATPPEGLSGSAWIGPGDGSGTGYWVRTLM